MKQHATCIALAIVGLLCAQGWATAQTAPATTPHVTLQKVIGQAKPEVVPSLFVINSRRASLKDGKLALIGVAPNSIVFADRPVRAAGHEPCYGPRKRTHISENASDLRRRELPIGINQTRTGAEP
jgi:hypothetical protein